MGHKGNKLRYLSQEEWERLKETPSDERGKLLLLVLYETGCTVKELVSIRKQDLGDSTIAISEECARNHEQRTVHVSQGLLARLRSYAADLAAEHETEYVFSTRQSPVMTTKRVRQLVQSYCRKAGLGKENPQVLRYTHIVHAYQKNIPFELIQRQVGLKKSRAVEIYEQLPKKEDMDGYSRFFA